jgi:1,4-alpha-glucan branching enzyme
MIKKITLALFLLLFGIGQVFAQLITADPAFPTDADAVTITFNAALGSQGLKGYTGTVYAHTGVITDKSANGHDWKYVKAGWTQNIPACQMTRIGTDLYQLKITPSIRTYYGVPSGEKILKMAFVFRSSDSKLTGKEADGGDIFYTVYEGGTNVKITLPSQQPDIVDLNDTVEVKGSSSYADSTYLLLDSQVLIADTASSFSYKIKATAYGKHWIIAKAVNGDKVVYDSAYFYVNRPPVMEPLPAGVKDGINYIDDQTVILSLYAPHKKHIFAIGDFSDWQVGDRWAMKMTPDSSRFWIKITGLVPHKQYVFQYLIDGSIRIGDPYADQVSDPWNDKYISSRTYPHLIPYPKGKTTGIATVLETAQTPYSWKVKNFKAPDMQNLVIYELLVRDFTKGHTFNDIIDTLGYLKHLGVNAIELMPVSEFEGNISWGYNPNYYFAVDKYYGPKNTFKAFVDSCHANGIAVIMDMVLNHAYGSCPLVMMYWDAAKNQPAADNPWFNQTPPNPLYHWGADFNHESQATQRFVDSVNHYWISQYHIDGYRFDFTKGFTNKPGDGWAYDQSRINILKRMANHIWSVKKNAYVILEHFTDNSEGKVLTDAGMSVWGNGNYNCNQTTMGYSNGSDFSWLSYEKRGYSNPAGVTGYMESHDEERLMYKNEKYGNASGSYNVKDIPTALKRMEGAGTFFFAIPGPKMIWQFGELGYDISINQCENGTIDENGGCRTHPKPVLWNYYFDTHRKHLYNVWSALIRLKETLPIFRTTNYYLELGKGLFKRIQLNSDTLQITILGNFDVKSLTVHPYFQKTGWWYDYFTGDSLNVTSTGNDFQMTMQPGEYHLYTSVKLKTPDFVTGIAQKEADNTVNDLRIFPNPVVSSFTVDWTARESSAGTISLYDITGRQVRQFYKGDFRRGVNHFEFHLPDLHQGLYFIVIRTSNGKSVKKLMVR